MFEGLNKVAILIVVILLVLMFSMAGSRSYGRENYGGKIKNIRKIPFNDCQRICDTYLKDCLSKYGSNDAMWCHERFGQMGTCVSECYYSNYQRL
jgi:hypothetical protein